MTLLAPWFLAAGAVVAMAVGALHFLAWGRPPEVQFPTARFVPDRPARAAARATEPADLLLLALRLLLVLLVALALAGPVRSASGRGTRRVVLADVSSAVRAPAEVRDSVRRLVRDGDVVIAFDTLARAVAANSSGVATVTGSAPGAGGALSVALVSAQRAAAGLRTRAESLELVVVSPLVSSEIDAATAELRALWRGRVRLVRVRVAAPLPVAALGTDGVAGDKAGGAADDPVVAALGLIRRWGESATVRVTRVASRTEDRLWAATGGRVLVEWPRDGAPTGWRRREPSDTVGAVVVSDAVAMGPFARRWRTDPAQQKSRVVARWADGDVAATELSTRDGCVRQVGFDPPEAGDAALRPGFLAVAAALVAPCAAVGGEPVSSIEATALAGAGPLLATSLLASAPGQRSPLAPWLLGLAMIVLVAEQLLRDRGRAE